MKTSNENIAVAAVLAGAFFWGLSWYPIKTLYAAGLSGAQLTLIAYGAGALAWLLLAWGQRGQWRRARQTLLLVALAGGYANLSFTVAMTEASAVRVLLLFYLSPVWTLIGAHWYLHEAVTWQRWGVVLLALLGAAIVLDAFSATTWDTGLQRADWLAISSGATYAMTNLTFRKHAGLGVASKNLALFGGATALAALWLALPALLTDAPAGGPVNLPNVLLWAAVAYGAVWLVLATGCSQYGVSHLPAARSVLLLTLEVPITAVSAWLIIHEQLHWQEWLGGACILLAVWLDARQRKSSAQ